MPEKPLKFLFVLNPSSGGKKSINWQPHIIEYFKKTPHAYETFELNGNDNDKSLQYWIDRYKPDRVVAVGGDGTVKFVAEYLIKTSLTMGILPGGSSNGMATELKIPTDDAEAALNIVTGDVIQPTDLIALKDNELCIHLSDVGLNATLVKYSAMKNWKGKFGYARGFLKMLIKKKRITAEIIMPDKTVTRSALMIVVANAKTYGTGAVINPKGKLTDGLFEVVVVTKISFKELLKIFWKKRGYDPKVIEIFKVSEVKINMDKSLNYQVDGEYIGKAKSIEAKVLPKKLQLLVPADYID